MGVGVYLCAYVTEREREIVFFYMHDILMSIFLPIVLNLFVCFCV